MTVVSIHPGVTREHIQENTGWRVRYAASASDTPPPSADELKILRELNARTAAAHGTSAETAAA
jgi:glutaconate CoA-transferase subunit B